MIYAVADIHGCYREFLELLEAIDFKDDDEMYILGDMMDKGPDPVKLVQDLMMRPNIYPLLGNHDYAALTVLSKFNTEITAENVDTHLSKDDMMSYMYWLQDGGDKTAEQFTKLGSEERQDVLEYLEDCSVYEEVSVNGREYVLVHAGINGFRPEKMMGEYGLADLILHRADYDRKYFEDKFLITGHTPAFKIREDGEPMVYEKNGHIAIDCGCIYGCRLAAYRLDDGKAFYVDSHQEVRYRKG